ncbi:LytR/AlgR family response regulator transcription factor [Brevundimonas sp. NPDC092305]|uniref:LytR/AlgR family response regulator transcription factor n=1 Tax=Brevundimonas sp. NPDC092305 TaxID=3363957 RepID=UPI003819CC59
MSRAPPRAEIRNGQGGTPAGVFRPCASETLKFLVVAADPEAREQLRRTVLDVYPAVHVVLSDRRHGLEAIRSHNPDIVLLDALEPVDLARVRDRRSAILLRPELIVVSPDKALLEDAFECDAAGYVQQPVRMDRLRAAVDRARDRLDLRRRAAGMLEAERDASTLAEEGAWVISRGGRIWLAWRRVERLEAAGDYVVLHTGGEPLTHRATVAEMAAPLEAAGLIRIHRSTMVRPERIARVVRSGRVLIAILTDGSPHRVGEKYRQDFRETLGLPRRVVKA